MTTRPRFSCCLRRRHFERISEMVMFAESSTNRGASLMREVVSATLRQSTSLILPACILDRRTPDSAESKRIAISWELISSEKMSEVMPCLMEAERQEVQGERGLAHGGSGGDDDHLAAVQAWVSFVQVGEAGGHAVELALVLLDVLERVEDVRAHLRHGHVVGGFAPVGDGVHLGLGLVDVSSTSPPASA